MADPKHLKALKQDIDEWNKWRAEHPSFKPDLSGADLIKADLIGADLSEALLFRADLREADLSEAQLQMANLSEALLSEAHLCSADLSSAHLQRADLYEADLQKANLSGAHLEGAELSMADLRDAYLYEACLQGASLINAQLSGASLTGVNFSMADLSEAYLQDAYLASADLRVADLRNARLGKADLWEADLRGADLSMADLHEANLREADLSDTDLSKARLTRAILVETDVTDATFTDCNVYGISVWNLRGEPKEQDNLVITREGIIDEELNHEPTITVDNLKVAQFIYLLVEYPELNEVIDTITSKVVLILGRFTEERKAVLDAIRNELRVYDLVPIMFDFARPDAQDYMGPVLTIANMARFIIADFTDAKMVIEEAPKVVTTCNKPLAPLLQEGWQEPVSLLDLRLAKRDYVLATHRYHDTESLLASLRESVIEPASRRVEELAAFRREVLGHVDEAVKEQWKQSPK